MPKYKPENRSQKTFFLAYPEDQIMPGTLEFVIHALIENRMDMTVLDRRYKNDDTGRVVHIIQRSF